MQSPHHFGSSSLKDRADDSFFSQLRDAVANFLARNGLVWLHLAKTVCAALIAMGIAMVLELPEPRTAVVTVLVLMQPMTGMVLAKSFYRILGTFAGAIAAVVLGSLFSQQPELYLGGLTLWTATCTALAVRFRHFRWYAFVLAGYTAALIGVPEVMQPDGLFIAALTRVAEVTVGILVSSGVSSLVFPVRASTALMLGQRERQHAIVALCADVLGSRCDRSSFNMRFSEVTAGISGFEAARTFAVFEDSDLRARSRKLAQIDSEYTALCSRLHMFQRLVERLRGNGAMSLTAEVQLSLERTADLLEEFQSSAGDSKSEEQVRGALAQAASALMPVTDVAHSRGDTAAQIVSVEETTVRESLRRLLRSLVNYLDNGAVGALSGEACGAPTPSTFPRTSSYVIALTFVRNAFTVALTGVFWVLSAWPSGGLAVITAAIVSGLTSAAPRQTTLAMQIAVGAACAVGVSYVYVCFVYPAIDGYPLLCAALVPVLAGSALLASRPSTSGYGIGLGVFFVLLALPDNMMTYAPDALLNDGVAIEVALLIGVVMSAVAFPLQTPWIIGRIQRDLRREVAFAWNTPLGNAGIRFRTRTHDLQSQLRMLLAPDAPQSDETWHWMLSTLEIGELLLDLRADLQVLGLRADPQASELVTQPESVRWIEAIEHAGQSVVTLFEGPNAQRIASAAHAVGRALAHAWLEQRSMAPGAGRVRLQQVASDLYLIHCALLASDSPFRAYESSSESR